MTTYSTSFMDRETDPHSLRLHATLVLGCTGEPLGTPVSWALGLGKLGSVEVLFGVDLVQQVLLCQFGPLTNLQLHKIRAK